MLCLQVVNGRIEEVAIEMLLLSGLWMEGFEGAWKEREREVRLVVKRDASKQTGLVLRLGGSSLPPKPRFSVEVFLYMDLAREGHPHVADFTWCI